MNKKGTGFLLDQFQNWWNFGRDYSNECSRTLTLGEEVTVTYEEVPRADGPSSFFVTEVWPTSGQRERPKPSIPQPTGPTPTNGPVKPDSYEGYQAAATGPVPTPPNRENAILFQVCLKAAAEWVPRRYRHGDPNRTEGQVLFVADLFYHDALKVISGELQEPQDGDPGPEEPA
jgi:hypothetical protein